MSYGGQTSFRDKTFDTVRQLNAIILILHTVPKNCLDVYTTGSKVSGVYIIDPADGSGPFKVFCDHVTDGGGWTVFQKRFDGSVNFKRTWQEYSDGFGDLSGEFWLGLNKIHRVAGRPVTLRVDLTAPDGEKRHANYNGFSVGDAASKYKLTAGKYSGKAEKLVLG